MSRTQQAPGVVKVRLSGDRAGIDTVAALLAGCCQVLDRSGPHPNRYDPGDRVYLILRISLAHAGPAARARTR